MHNIKITNSKLPKNFWALLLTTTAKGHLAPGLIANVQSAYAKTSGGSFVNELKDVLGSQWLALDWDPDPEPDSVLFFRTARFDEPWRGFKIQGIGHDGQKTSIDKLMERLKKQLKVKGWWIEASDAMEHVLYKDPSVNCVVDEALAQKIFKDPKLKFDKNSNRKGRYKRSVAYHGIVSESIFGLPELK